MKKKEPFYIVQKKIILPLQHRHAELCILLAFHLPEKLNCLKFFKICAVLRLTFFIVNGAPN